MIALRHGTSRQLLRALSGKHLQQQFARWAVDSFCIANFGDTGVCLRSLLYQGNIDTRSGYVCVSELSWSHRRNSIYNGAFTVNSAPIPSKQYEYLSH